LPRRRRARCRVPTARPGTSEHEKGLAVDFTYNGQTICFPRPGSQCSGNPAFDWLKANAHRYGLKNLPSEAWHWSTTGR
jgi:LAS superfamily LD-carboxypeptidase LdcB